MSPKEDVLIMSKCIYTFRVGNEQKGVRLLRFLQDKIDINRKHIRFSIEHQGCLINGAIERFASRKLSPLDKISFQLICPPQLGSKNILFEDEYLLAYNKPAHISTEKLQEELKYSYAHRLDKGTSGILLFAKDTKTLSSVEELFRKREVHKEYLTWVKGTFPDKERLIKQPIQCKKKVEGKIYYAVDPLGKEAITHFFLITKTASCSLLRALPLTGRTHQIRVHLQYLGFPVCGDVDYGEKKQPLHSRPLLHAEKISFIHPQTEKKIEIISPCPEDFNLR